MALDGRSDPTEELPMNIDQEKLNAGKVIGQAHNVKAQSVWNSAGRRYDQEGAK